MPKYANDVNKQTKIIDIQKQFPGGLKTVDTDDALGQVYLREAENVSLSEFSFLEKRYGLSQEELFEFQDSFPNVDTLQGYFEFTRENGQVDKLLFADGKAFIKQGNGPFIRQETFYTEDNFVYPDLTSIFDTDQQQVLAPAIAIPLTASVSIGLSENINSPVVNVSGEITVSASGNVDVPNQFIAPGVFTVGTVSLTVSANSDLLLFYTAPNASITANATVTSTQSTEMPASSWTYIGTTNPTYDVSWDLFNDGGYITSTCPTSSGFVSSFLPSASNYSKGTIIRVSSYENSQGFPQACPGFFYYEAV